MVKAAGDPTEAFCQGLAVCLADGLIADDDDMAAFSMIGVVGSGEKPRADENGYWRSPRSTAT